MEIIPKVLNCKVNLNGASIIGVMLNADSGMSKKNSYSFIFCTTDSTGHAKLDRSIILSGAKAQLEAAIMDYDPIEAGFTGKISVNAMSEG